MGLEKGLHDDLVPYIMILLNNLEKLASNEILTKKGIDEVVAKWREQNKYKIIDTNISYLNKIDKYTKGLILGRPVKDNHPEKDLIFTMANSNYKLLDIAIHTIENKFDQLSILQRDFKYPFDKIKEAIPTIINTTNNSLELISTSVIMNAFRALLVDHALDYHFDEYQWQTMEDDKVRKTHREMNKRWFKVNDESPQPAGCKPGVDYNCRCWISHFRRS